MKCAGPASSARFTRAPRASGFVAFRAAGEVSKKRFRDSKLGLVIVRSIYDERAPAGDPGAGHPARHRRRLTGPPARATVPRMTTHPVIPLALCAVMALSAGLQPERIPGTEIEDKGDNRAVYEVVRAYQKALEGRDAAAILALVSPDYFDTAGTPDPGGRLDRALLEQSLPAGPRQGGRGQARGHGPEDRVQGDTATPRCSTTASTA